MIGIYPIQRIAVSGADDPSSFLDHLEDDTAMNVAHYVGVIWSH